MIKFNVVLDDDGGFVIPESVRESMNIQPNEPLFVSVDEFGVHFQTEAQLAKSNAHPIKAD